VRDTDTPRLSTAPATMSVTQLFAAIDIASILAFAVGNIFQAAAHTAICRGLAYSCASIASWVNGLPRDDFSLWLLETYLYFFVRSTAFSIPKVKSWYSAIGTIMTRDRPPDGLPGAEVAKVITDGVLLAVYMISTLMFDRWGLLEAFTSAYAIITGHLWLLVLIGCILLGGVLVLSVVDHGPFMWLKTTFRALFSLPVHIAFALYNAPYRAVELGRHWADGISKISRPTLELWHLRNPALLYTYTKPSAKKKEIRLIKLERRYPGCDISCSLVRFPLARTPPYEAISYTWGSSVKDHLVFFGGKWLPTTRNVYQLLHDRSSFSRTRWLWIDAVCINQDDVEEKNAQVQMMGEIYRAAERVVVWLDDRNLTHTEITHAFLLLEVINFTAVDQPDAYTGITKPVGQESHWRALHKFLSHPYWCRAWIIQEVALAKEVHIVCSGKYFAWDHLVKMMVNLLLNHGKIMVAAADLHLNIGASRIYTGVSQILAISLIRESAQSNKAQSLSTCLSTTPQCLATNPQDRIFALYNVAKWPDKKIRVDYAMDVADVFASTATCLLAQDPRFVLLAAGIGFPRQTLGLRSWVPDFASLPKGGLFEVGIAAEDRYSAGGSRGTTPHVQEVPGGIIAADVVFVSRIVGVSATKPEADVSLNGVSDPPLATTPEKHQQTTLTATRDLFRAAWKLKEQLPSRYIYAATSQPVEEAFWRTLIADRQLEQSPDSTAARYLRPAGPQLAANYAAFREMCLQGDDDTASGNLKDATQSPEGQFYATFTFSRLFRPVSAGWAFAFTQSGLMGLVPELTEVGDLVCVLPGFEMPLLVRGVTGKDGKARYQLVGPCYMHGVMNGEILLKDCKPEKVEFV